MCGFIIKSIQINFRIRLWFVFVRNNNNNWLWITADPVLHNVYFFRFFFVDPIFCLFIYRDFYLTLHLDDSVCVCNIYIYLYHSERVLTGFWWFNKSALFVNDVLIILMHRILIAPFSFTSAIAAQHDVSLSVGVLYALCLF